MRSAQAAGLHLISLNWLLESIEARKVLAEKDFIFDTAVAPTPSNASNDVPTLQHNTVTAPRTGTRTSKRTASNLKDMGTDKDAEEEKPLAKKTKGVSKEQTIGVGEMTKPTTKKATAVSRRRAKDGEQDEDKMDIDKDEEEEEEKEQPVVKGDSAAAKVKTSEGVGPKGTEKPTAINPKTPAMSRGKGKGKAKKEATPEPEEEGEEEEEKKEDEVKPKMKTVIKKGKAPVDELCPGSSKPPHFFDVLTHPNTPHRCLFYLDHYRLLACLCRLTGDCF